MTEHNQETKIAILEAKVEHMMGHVKELTMRVRANEKVVAIVSAIGIGAGGIVGTTAFAPKSNAESIYIEQAHSQPYITGSNTHTIMGWMNKMKAWETEQRMKDSDFNINSALVEYFNNGGNDTTESKELLQFSSDGNSQSLGWRYY